MMIADKAEKTARVADFLLSWDRLGFRFLVFGSLALVWIFQGRILDMAWSELIRGELGGIMLWVFFAPIILSLSRRIRIDRLGPARFLGAHVLGMVLVFIPFWLTQRGVYAVWACFASGWNLSRLTILIPTAKNVLGSFANVPFVYLFVLLGAEAMKHAEARRAEAIRVGRLAGQLSDARLALLQRQLHPHFLFNALQAISTLLHRDPKTADALLLRLSMLLRAMLEDASGQTLSLRTELDLTRKYLEIEQVRFGDRLCVEWHVDESVLEMQVPSLIVLPLVDNAIRHGLSPKVGPGHLTICAESDDASLILTVKDDGLGTALPLRHGLGIGNTQARLDAMYGERATLEIDTRPNAGFRASMRIPLGGSEDPPDGRRQ
jgi:signal transduction histidine kinase